MKQAGGVLAWRDRLLLNLWDRRPVVRAADGAPLAGDTLCVVANDRLAAVDLRAGRVRWQVPTGVAIYRPPWWERMFNVDAPSERPFDPSGVAARDGKVLVIARDRCLYVVDDRTGAVAGRQCGLGEPWPGSPLISTPEVTVYRTLGELVAYPLRTG